MQRARMWRGFAGALVTVLAVPAVFGVGQPALRAATGGSQVGAAASATNPGGSADSASAPTTGAAARSTRRSADRTRGTTPRSTLPATDPVANQALLDPVDVPRAGARDPLVRIGSIAIPAIGLRQPLFEGIAQNVINAGPAHWPGTAAPGGEGNAVIAGHRSTYTQPFHSIANARVGDTIVFETASGWRYTYRITKQFVVASNAMWITDQRPGHTVTLFTCHPIGSARQRLVTVGDLVDSERLA